MRALHHIIANEAGAPSTGRSEIVTPEPVLAAFPKIPNIPPNLQLDEDRPAGKT